MTEYCSESKVFTVYNYAFSSDTIGVTTYASRCGADLETGVKGCKIKPGDSVEAQSPVPLEQIGLKHRKQIKIFAQACLGCRLNKCKIRR